MIQFEEVIKGTMWTREELIESTENDPEISVFYKKLMEGGLPIEEKELAGMSPVTKSLHAQWEKYSIREGVMYRNGWNDHEQEKKGQVVLQRRHREEAMMSAYTSLSGGHLLE